RVMSREPIRVGGPAEGVGERGRRIPLGATRRRRYIGIDPSFRCSRDDRMRRMEVDRVTAPAEVSARWPGRLRELAALRVKPAHADARDEILAELWTLLNLALHRYVRGYARRFPRIGP